MPRLSSLTKQHPVSTTFEAEGESLTVVFDRNKITQAWLRQIQEASVTGDFAAISRTTLEVLISWDVVDDAGNPLPPSLEILESLPMSAFGELNTAIAEAAVPSSEEGEVSSEVLSRPASVSSPTSPELQNGQPASPSPAPSASPSPS